MYFFKLQKRDGHFLDQLLAKDRKKRGRKKQLKAKGDLTWPPLVLESLWERCAVHPVNIFK